MQERDDIELIIEAQKRSVEYFSGKNKKTREICIVKFFLDILDVNYQETQLIPASAEPPDVGFRDASFEVKEILPKDSKRHEECKQALEKTERTKYAITDADLCEDHPARAITLGETMARIQEKLEELSTICPTVRRSTDLLLYVCLGTFYELGPYNIPQRSHDWRSVSVCTNSKLALVLAANQEAPDFIRKNVRRLIL